MNGSDRSKIDLNLFRVFDAVYRGGGITQAAADLNVTQPAVSNALARLRLHFDDPLFVREGRRIVPTAVARGLSGEVARALGSLEDTLRHGHRFDPKTSTRRFVIGLRDALEAALLPALVHDLSKIAPQIRLQSTRIERSRVARQLGAGELDLVLDVPMVLGEDVRQEVVLRADLCVAMRVEHPLSRRALTIERWLSARHVVVSARASGPVLEDLALQSRNLRRDVAVRCQHYYAACQIVAHSDLLLTMPRYGAYESRAALPLHLTKMPLPMGTLNAVMYWHRTAETDAGNAWLRERVTRIAVDQASPRRALKRSRERSRHIDPKDVRARLDR